MSFPLLNRLSKESIELNLNNCCGQQKELLEFYFPNRFNFNSFNYEVLIDFRCDEQWKNAQEEISKYRRSIGFGDWKYSYDLELELPKNFYEDFACEIYLQVLDKFKLKNFEIDFTIYGKWKKLNQQKITLIPGSGHKERSLDICYFIYFYNELSKRKFNVNIIFGPQEIVYFEKYHTVLNCYLSDTISDFHHLINKSQVVVTNEGGAMHLSCTYGVPCITIFNSSRPINWFPYQQKKNSIIDLGNTISEPRRNKPTKEELFNQIYELVEREI